MRNFQIIFIISTYTAWQPKIQPSNSKQGESEKGLKLKNRCWNISMRRRNIHKSYPFHKYDWATGCKILLEIKHNKLSWTKLPKFNKDLSGVKESLKLPLSSHWEVLMADNAKKALNSSNRINVRIGKRSFFKNFTVSFMHSVVILGHKSTTRALICIVYLEKKKIQMYILPSNQLIWQRNEIIPDKFIGKKKNLLRVIGATINSW